MSVGGATGGSADLYVSTSVIEPTNTLDSKGNRLVNWKAYVQNVGTETSGKYMLNSYIDDALVPSQQEMTYNGLAAGKWYITPYYSSYIPAGSHRLKLVITPLGSDANPSNNEYTQKFEVNGASSNLPPVINGVGGPTSLAANAVGTWKLSAYDPEGSYINVGVEWGDGSKAATPVSGSLLTFQHTYAQGGTYKIVFTVTDDKGAQAQSTVTVAIISSIAPSEKLSFKIKKGWNMLSSPAETTSGIDVMAIAQKCDVAANAWEYDAANGKYVVSTSIKPKGAWLRANADCEFEIAPPYTTRVRFALSAGWNVVGAPGTSASISSMSGNCKVTSGPWSYSPSAGQYTQSSVLEPTKAYWVKVASACTMENTGDAPPSAPTN